MGETEQCWQETMRRYTRLQLEMLLVSLLDFVSNPCFDGRDNCIVSGDLLERPECKGVHLRGIVSNATPRHMMLCALSRPCLLSAPSYASRHV